VKDLIWLLATRCSLHAFRWDFNPSGIFSESNVFSNLIERAANSE